MTTVCLHIGAMKSGTTFVQRVLARNKRLLLDQGCLFPGRRWADQVLAVDDVKGEIPPGKQRHAGAWDSLVEEVLAYRGDTAVISMEGLSMADHATARRVVDSFRDRDVRVILTARDLGRGVPAQWQETVKNGAPISFGRYLALISAPGARRLPRVARFWGPQDLPRILRTWQPLVAPESLKLVTVPPPGARSHVLWERFSSAAGLPDVPLDFDVRRNPSLGAHSVELIRRLNQGLSVHDTWPLRQAVKGSLANGVLANRASQEPAIEVPVEFRPWVARTARMLVREIDQIAPTVVGTTDDLLVPDWEGAPWRRLSAVRRATGSATGTSDHDLVAAAVDAIAGLVPLVSQPDARAGRTERSGTDSSPGPA